MSTNFEKHYQAVVKGVSLEDLRDILINKSGNEELAYRFRSLFNLKIIAEEHERNPRQALTAVKYIGEIFGDNSELIKHEAAYILGQTDNVAAIPILRSIMLDLNQQPMVRHEAAEALGALNDNGSIPFLEKCLSQDTHVAVKETCELSLERIKWFHDPQSNTEKTRLKSKYESTDPAPAFARNKKLKVKRLKKLLNDTNQSIFTRYRAMFTLRDIGTMEAIWALHTAFDNINDSALLKHEVAYVLGQLSSPYSVLKLTEILGKLDEAPMVRHEAAEALGAIASPDVVPVLQYYQYDEVDVVRESAIVALDMHTYETNKEMEYAIA